MKKLLFPFAIVVLTGCDSTPTKQPTTPSSTSETHSIVMEYDKNSVLDYETPLLLLNEKGDTIAPMGKYSWTPETKSGNDIIFVIGENGYAYVDANGKELDYRPFIFDNAPDRPSNGLIRIVNKDDKMGYADSLGHVIIAPQFFFAEPWGDGFGKVAPEGKKISHGEHWKIEVKEWMKVDLKGNISPWSE